MTPLGLYSSGSSGTTSWVCSLSHWSGLPGSWLDPGRPSRRAMLTPVTGWDGNPAPRTVAQWDLGPARLPWGLSHATLPGPASCQGWPRAGPGDSGPDTGSKVHTCARTPLHTSDIQAQPPWGWGDSDQGSLARTPGSPGKHWGKREPGQKHAEARPAETRAQARRHAHTQRCTRPPHSCGKPASRAGDLEAGCGPGHQRLLPGPQEGRGGSS